VAHDDDTPAGPAPAQPPREPATLVVLAGGHSRRMGRDKGLLPIDGKPMIQHLVERLAPRFDEVLISGGTPDTYRFLGVAVVPDALPDQGPLGGLLAALQAARNPLCLVVACDMPNVSADLVERMLSAADGVDAVVPRVEGQVEPVCAVYRRALIPWLRAALARGERGVYRIFEGNRVRFVEPGSADELLNLNTPEEYEAFHGRRPDGPR
jgi:molybdopterin-guanine dinucleotide biosynthesis protein A